MYGGSRQSKPWPGVKIDADHPLAQGLQFALAFNEGSGAPIELINRVVPSTATSGWASTVDGWAASFNGSTTQLVYPAPKFPSFPGITVLARGSFATTTGVTHTLVERSLVNAKWNFYVSNGTVTWRGAAASNRVAVGVTFTANKIYTLIATDTLSLATLYSQGIQIGTGSSGAAPVDSATNINIGQVDSGSSNFWNGSGSLILVWNRALSALECGELSANPWQIFQPAWPRGLVIEPRPVHASAVRQVSGRGRRRPGHAHLQGILTTTATPPATKRRRRWFPGLDWRRRDT